MGCGEEDGSFFLLNNIQPDSFNTTHMILQQMDRGNVDFILHLGDISYARGFSSVVSGSVGTMLADTVTAISDLVSLLHTVGHLLQPN